MLTSITQLRGREVVCTADGNRLGFVEDVEIDMDSGIARALLVPGRARLFGREQLVIPWSDIVRFGEEIILVSRPPQARRE